VIAENGIPARPALLTIRVFRDSPDEHGQVLEASVQAAILVPPLALLTKYTRTLGVHLRIDDQDGEHHTVTLAPYDGSFIHPGAPS
jgi:hypothetical protein